MLLAFHSALCLAAKDAPSELPDAPTPQQSQANTIPASTSSYVNTKPYANFYWRTIPPKYRARPLTPFGKLKFVAREMVNPTDLAPALVSAGWGVWVDSNPMYGTNADAFGQRFGAAIVRQSSFRLFSDGLLTIAFQEDPRYYRLGEAYTPIQRAKYALTRIFIGRTDTGQTTVDYSGILGRAFGAALTPAYYPSDSRTSKVVFQTFGTAIAGEMGLDFLREFFPGTHF